MYKLEQTEVFVKFFLIFLIMWALMSPQDDSGDVIVILEIPIHKVKQTKINARSAAVRNDQD